MAELMSINYQSVLDRVFEQAKNTEMLGEVASYIPELAHVDPQKLGIHLITTNNEHFHAGDADEKFSIQSISKVLSLTLAFKALGDRLWQRVGIEPSGTAFNSLVQLEYEQGIPRNPFLNAGAIVICDVLVSQFDNPKDEILRLCCELSGNPEVSINETVAKSELDSSFRNCSLANFMKSFGNIENDIATVLDVYFYLCAIEMTCKEMAQTFMFLAENGVNPLSKKTVVTSSEAKRLNAILQLCGFYDEAGEFSFKVGLPGKSGVGGGIIAIHPQKYSVAVWSPKLNKKGNSYLGMKMLESLTTISQSSIF